MGSERGLVNWSGVPWTRFALVMGHVAIEEGRSENNFATMLDCSSCEVESWCGVSCEVNLRLHKVMGQKQSSIVVHHVMSCR